MAGAWGYGNNQPGYQTWNLLPMSYHLATTDPFTSLFTAVFQSEHHQSLTLKGMVCSWSLLETYMAHESTFHNPCTTKLHIYQILQCTITIYLYQYNKNDINDHTNDMEIRKLQYIHSCSYQYRRHVQH